MLEKLREVENLLLDFQENYKNEEVKNKVKEYFLAIYDIYTESKECIDIFIKEYFPEKYNKYYKYIETFDEEREILYSIITKLIRKIQL